MMQVNQERKPLRNERSYHLHTLKESRHLRRIHTGSVTVGPRVLTGDDVDL